ncbi:MAG TPA: hypothetical protein VLM79_33485 [Kofleriaceae bacterium]|nr:hypothetical protein [Kofleriaceae bacterium]
MRRGGAVALAAAALATAACKSGREPARNEAPAPRDGGAADAADVPDAPRRWTELAGLPSAEAVRVIALPARPDVPRFNVGGPAIADDIAVVSSSQFGFLAIDWRRGSVAWTRPSGLHVAPPVARRGDAILIGDCLNPPELPDASETLLGCLRVVTAAGDDQTYAAIHGKRVEAFAAEPGPQEVWLDGERAVRWRRGEQAVAVDLFSGVARPTPAEPPPVHVTHQGRAWDVAQRDGRIVARARGKLAWQTEHTYTALLGAVYLDEQSPMVRVANVGAFGGRAEMNLLDIDATGSLHGQAAFPVPAISLLGHAIDEVGNTAIAIRLDSSLRRDFVVGYAANALMMYVWALPEVQRADPVGVAVAPDAVLVFHDGDTFTVLPELSAPPTAPGAPRAPSQNPTP